MTIEIAPGIYPIRYWKIDQTCTIFDAHDWELYIYLERKEAQLIPRISGNGVMGKLHSKEIVADDHNHAVTVNGDHTFTYKIDGFTLTGKIKGRKIETITIIV